MQIKNLSTLYLVVISILTSTSGCRKSTPCMIKELRSESTIISYKYNDNNEVSIKTIIDTAVNSKEIYRYKRDNQKLIIFENESELQTYYLDDNQRLSSYSYNNGTNWEYNFKYDSKGRLASAKRERFIQSNLFTTNYIKIDYEADNPITITDSCVLDNNYKENGSNSITRYFISYYADHEVKYTNDAVLPITAGYLHEFTYLGYKDSAGKLPNKLIKTIVKKTDGEPSSRQDFTYKVDNKGNVIEIIITHTDIDHKPAKRTVALAYQCTNDEVHN